jgi:hypothetical protein
MTSNPDRTLDCGYTPIPLFLNYISILRNILLEEFNEVMIDSKGT